MRRIRRWLYEALVWLAEKAKEPSQPPRRLSWRDHLKRLDREEARTRGEKAVRWLMRQTEGDPKAAKVLYSIALECNLNSDNPQRDAEIALALYRQRKRCAAHR